MKFLSRRNLSYLLALILALGLFWQLSFAYTLTDISDRQKRLQDVQLNELDRQLNQFSYVPRLLSEDVEIRSALLQPGESTLLATNRRLARTQRDSGLDVAFLLNAEGLTVASSNWADPVSFVGVNYAFRPYFKQAVRGTSASFFAVGATTGIPGYFLAEPVRDSGTVLGVIVVKIALDVLVDAWSQLPYESLVIDEFGGVILSTRQDLLYTPMVSLSEQEIGQLQLERRYDLQPAKLLGHDAGAQQRNIEHADTEESFHVFSQPLVTEPWQLLTLVAETRIHRQALLMMATAASIALIIFLCIRLFQQQRRLVQSEQRNSQELEEQVVMRTRELELAQQRLISESNFAMLGRMSAAINHEINQPLASLRLNLASLRTMIERPEADQIEISQIVVDSDRTTKRIGRVISSLRSLARKNDSRFQLIGIEKVVLDVFDTVKRERVMASQALVVDVRDGDFKIMGDEVLIQQALLNLLYNAFDAVLSTGEPEVILSLQASDSADSAIQSPGADICLSVSDNGAGVSASVAATLFQPFATTRGHHDGLGLGLTIARQIAVDHGGELKFHEREVGSRFTLVLPAAQTVAAGMA